MTPAEASSTKNFKSKCDLTFLNVDLTFLILLLDVDVECDFTAVDVDVVHARVPIEAFDEEL